MSDSKDAGLDKAAAFLDDDAAAAERRRQAEVDELGERIIEALKAVYDPEIPVNIYDLGLIYRVDIDDDDKVMIQMTLTSPACPVASARLSL
jgi:metal-sulfur cluster biosynthetic enzyme